MNWKTLLKVELWAWWDKLVRACVRACVVLRSTLFLVHLNFFRVGKRGGPWDGLVDAAFPRGLAAEALAWQPAEPRPLLTLLPRWRSVSTEQKQEWTTGLGEVIERRRKAVWHFSKVRHTGLSEGLFWGLDNFLKHSTFLRADSFLWI